jgi:hypothetical protein
MEFPCEHYYAFCEVQAGHGVGASAPGWARYLSAKHLILALVGFDELSNFGTGSNRVDEYDGSLVQEQKAGLRTCPAKEYGPGSIGKHVRKPSSGATCYVYLWSEFLRAGCIAS